MKEICPPLRLEKTKNWVAKIAGFLRVSPRIVIITLLEENGGFHE